MRTYSTPITAPAGGRMRSLWLSCTPSAATALLGKKNRLALTSPIFALSSQMPWTPDALSLQPNNFARCSSLGDACFPTTTTPLCNTKTRFKVHPLSQQPTQAQAVAS